MAEAVLYFAPVAFCFAIPWNSSGKCPSTSADSLVQTPHFSLCGPGLTLTSRTISLELTTAGPK